MRPVSTVLLSAAMIVRDEAHHLPACLRSIRDLVDEIVVTDTGSSDESVAIARSFGARVETQPWRGDFSAPRNHSLDLARGRWILYIDADERVAPVDLGAFRDRLTRAQEVSLRVRLRPFTGATPYWEYRLWRSDPRIRFVGKMHEKMTPAIAAVAAADGLSIDECELLLDHVGYDGDQSHKHRRNRPLLEAQLALTPDEPYSWRHLAAVLNASGEHDQAEAALEEAARRGAKRLPEVGALATAELIARRRQRGEDVATLVDDAARRYPDSFAVLWEQVVSEIQAGRCESALAELARFDIDTEMPAEDVVAYVVELFGPRAAEARGLCLFRLGRYAEAAEAYRRAEELEPGYDAHRLKRILCEARAARQPPAARDPAGEAAASGWSSRQLLAGITLDIAGVPVEFRATDAMRAHAIHALFSELPPTNRAPRAELRFGRHRLATPERAPDESYDAMAFWHEEPLSIACGARLSARAQPGRMVLGGESADLARAFRSIAPFLLAAVLGRQERFVLHAAAIRTDQETILVIGHSGTGKSTIAAGALSVGWSVLSDDLVALRGDGAGLYLRGIPRPIVIPREAAPPDVPTRPVVDDPRDRVLLAHTGWDHDWHRITDVVLAGHGTSAGVAVDPVGDRQLLTALLAAMLSRQPDCVRRYLPLALRLCGLPARRLLLGTDAVDRGRRAAEMLRVRPKRLHGLDDVADVARSSQGH
jgi:tetratricopeptide (TPR) repeat protein